MPCWNEKVHNLTQHYCSRSTFVPLVIEFIENVRPTRAPFVWWKWGVRLTGKLNFIHLKCASFLALSRTPRFHQDRSPPFPQQEKGEETGSEREHERQKGHIIVLYCLDV